MQAASLPLCVRTNLSQLKPVFSQKLERTWQMRVRVRFVRFVRFALKSAEDECERARSCR